jgi:hypothetical protein
MRVDLFGVLLLQTEEHLDRLASVDKLHNIVLDLEMGLRGVLVNMGCDGFVVDMLLGDAFLVYTHTSQQSPGPGVDLGSTIADNTNDDLLPGVFTPCLTVWSVTHVLDVLENTSHGSGKQNLVLVVHCHDDEQLSVARLAEEPLSQRKVVIVEIVGIARSSGIAHVCKFVSLSVGILLQQKWRNAAIKNEITTIQGKLLDGFPTLYATTAALLRLLVLLARDFRMLVRQHRSVIRYIVVVLVALIVGLVLRAGLIGLIVIGIVVSLWVNSIVARGAVTGEIVH